MNSQDSGEITGDKINMFLALVNDYYKEFARTSGNVKGDVVEYLVHKLGPLKLSIGHPIELAKCKVQGQTSNCDMDFVFHTRGYTCNEELCAEMVEVKANLNTFVPLSERENFEHSEMPEIKKLRYMRDLVNLLACSQQSAVLLATMISNDSQHKEFLKDVGLGEIAVLNYLDLKRLMKAKFA